MARRLSWSDVRGGLLAVFAIGAVVFGILTYARVGVLHGDTFRLYALMAEARGVFAGSEVWLSGQKIGKIVRIDFRPPATDADTLARLLIEMEILEKHRAVMHRDADAQIRAGGSVIGSPVLYLTAGTTGTGDLQPGDTVRARQQADFEGAASEFGYASREFPAIISNVKALAAQLDGTSGTIGAFMNSPGGGQISRAQASATRLGNQMRGSGSVGLALRGGLGARAGTVMARADSVRALLASPNTSFGRFKRDSSLMAHVADIRNELSIVKSLIDEPRGTVGRALRDSALTNALDSAAREMALLFADMKKHPLRYISF